MENNENFQQRELEFRKVDLRADYGELGKVEYVGFEMDLGGEEPWLLHWENTKIKTYKDATYNHVEVTDENGEKFGFASGEDEFLAMLWQHGFPLECRPMPEQETHELIVGMIHHVGQMALEEFLKEQE